MCAPDLFYLNCSIPSPAHSVTVWGHFCRNPPSDQHGPVWSQAYASINGWPNTSTVRSKKPKTTIHSAAPKAGCNDHRYMSIRGQGVLLLVPGALHSNNMPEPGGTSPTRALHVPTCELSQRTCLSTGTSIDIRHKRGRTASDRVPVMAPPPLRRPKSAVPVGYHCYRLDQNASPDWHEYKAEATTSQEKRCWTTPPPVMQVPWSTTEHVTVGRCVSD